MRIIAGKYRGRSLSGPKHKGLRPTADRVKEALFNIIGADINEASFLDLFAGTGSIGIEALSRGAGKVVFADENQQSIKLLRGNLSFLDEEDQQKIRILHLSSGRALDLFYKEAETFDLIFLDPPFEGDLYLKTIEDIALKNLLKKNGRLIVEHPQKIVLEDVPFENCKTRNYGDICLSFLSN